MLRKYSFSKTHKSQTSPPLFPTDDGHPLAIVPPIISSYNERIRPVLDAVENLRRLNITKEGIQLPTIVVVGDQSSGKSSVLESLAGISLPRGQGICTRVPLVMRLQNHPIPKPQLILEYKGKSVSTDEQHVSEAIKKATDEIAGHGKGITNTPLTLLVKKNGVPDLTMVDLPGITRVAVRGQPENIYDQVKDIIMEYIKPNETIILNVLSASVDFSTCESIRMSQSVDKSGMRTLAVVTKADKAPEGLLEKVTADDVNIGLGYVCVRNRIGDESYKEARIAENNLFETHLLLSKIDKSIVGIPVLAKKLVKHQTTILSKTLPELVKKINDKLSSQLSEIDNLPRNITSTVDATAALMHIIGLVKESLSKILVRGEFDEFPDDSNMHCTSRLAEMLNSYSKQLHESPENDPTKDFLIEEVNLLEETKWIGLPNFLPRHAFLSILQSKVKRIKTIPISLVDSFWNYLQNVVSDVLNKHSENYHRLKKATCIAAGNLTSRMRDASRKHVAEATEMEKLTDYTCDPGYMCEYNRLMMNEDMFIKQVFEDVKKPARIQLDGVGKVVEVGHLRRQRSESQVIMEAFDLKMRMISYWRIVLIRLVDTIALHLQHSINNLVKRDLEEEIIKNVMSICYGGVERLFEESPCIAGRRERLLRSFEVLKKSKEVVGDIMERVSNFDEDY